MRRILSIALIFVLCPHAYGQVFPQHSAGVRVAGGYYGDGDNQGGTRAIVGAEACLFCEGRRAFFLEYSHFFPGSGVYDSADLVAGGIRLQTRRKALLFLFDVGGAVGNSRVRSTSVSTAGFTFGSGLQINMGPRLYVNPFFRIYPMSHANIAGSFGTGLGLRF